MENNSKVIEILNKKKNDVPDKRIMVRIPFEDNTCLDFDYVNINELIEKLKNNELNLSPNDLQAFVIDE